MAAGLIRRAGAQTGVALVVAIAAAAPAAANPEGGLVVGGSATIVSTPGLTIIQQKSEKAIINWQRFSIGADEVTRFHQPGRNAIALNRVISKDASVINGRLQANGNVWIVNRNGVLFGPSAQVDVHGIVATTTDIRDNDFLNGHFHFALPSPEPGAAVVNQGAIRFGETGLAALVAPHARNEGMIVGRLGQVVIAGAPAFTLDLYGDGLIRFAATAAATPAAAGGGRALAETTGAIHVDGGIVLLTAEAAAGVVDRLINAGGVIEAKGVATSGGEIVLHGGDDGTVAITGRLDVSPAAAAPPGAVRASGAAIHLADGARVEAGGGEVALRAVSIVGGADGTVQTGTLTLTSTAATPADAGSARLTGTIGIVTAGVSTADGAPFASLALRNGASLTVGGEGIHAGSVHLTVDGTLTLNQPIVAASAGNSIVLVASGLRNELGPLALAPQPGRFLIYTANPAGNRLNGLSGAEVFNASFASVPPAAVAVPGNVFLYAAPPPSPSPPPPSPPAIVLTPEQLVQATQVGPGFGLTQAGSSAALEASLPPRQMIQAPPRREMAADGDVLFANDGNHALWDLSTAAAPLP